MINKYAERLGGAMKKFYSNLRILLSQRLTGADIIRLTFVILLAVIMSLWVSHRTTTAVQNTAADAFLTPYVKSPTAIE